MEQQTQTDWRTTKFWAAATLGVPLLLSAALLLTLTLEMSLTAGGIEHHISRVMAVAIVEVIIAGGFAWGVRRSDDRAAGAAVAAVIVGAFLLAGLVLTL